MAEATVELKKPLGPDAIAGINNVLARSFDGVILAQANGCLTLSVIDELDSAELQKRLKQVLRARALASDECIFERDVSDHPGADPQPALEAHGDVVALAPGLFAFRGDFLRVRTALDAAVQAIAVAVNAQELAYPPLWPIQVLQSIDYFHDFPHLPLLAPGVAPNYAARAAFAARFRAAAPSQPIVCSAENGFTGASNVLAPTVCDCCYWLLRGRGDVADHVVTIHGNVFRNEASPDARLDRLTAYTMREIVMIGAESFVLDVREQIIGHIERLVEGLDLACRIQAADDPFFTNDALQKNLYQNFARLKYEVVAPLFAGRSCAVASVNLHNDFFSRNYGYHGSDGASVASACVGFGYERLAYALFCRHGAELNAWPAPVRQYLKLD